MNLEKLKALFAEKGCQKIYVKILSSNDISKSQVYLGGNFEVLNILPVSKIITEDTGKWVRERFKASMDFSWIGEDGNIYPAPNAQLILYPKYPEVRFSGFLSKCQNPPSELMNSRLSGRLLFLSVTTEKKVLGYVASPTSIISREFARLSIASTPDLFKVIELPQAANSKKRLIHELRRIHNLDWIKSKRLDAEGILVPCEASNCGGFTLEAELGIRTNARAEPDYLGWEIKQFGVRNFDHINSAPITLMTPEPTAGFYVDNGKEAFILKYGYDDMKGRADRKNFGGVHKLDLAHKKTKLTMKLIGYDEATGKIINAGGMIALFDKKENIAASWSFSSMLEHWNKKHNQACFIPSLSAKLPEQKYKYGNNVILGIGTDFQLFLKQMASGNVYYDPGIKMENASTKPKFKARSQFRIKSRHLSSLYKVNESVNVDG